MSSAVPPPEVLIVGGGSLGLLALLAATYPLWKYPLLGFFTRLRPPRILEQGTRSKIFDLIQAQPGIRANHIVKRLGTATGQTMYHLHVLTRERLVTRTRNPFGRRYFVTGTISPQAMQHQASLQTPSLAELQRIVQAEPGLSLSEYAKRMGLSVARISRMAAQLAQAHLIERVLEGRKTTLHPRRPHP